MADDYVDIADLRRSVDKVIYEALKELDALGWKIRKQGHNIRLYCPCGHQSGAFSVGGTVRSPGDTAKRIRKNAQNCPDKHDLIK
jgi:hypothetical protein